MLVAIAAATAFPAPARADRPCPFDQGDHGQTSKLELTPVPLIGGSSDVGFGGGALVSLARVDPAYSPYVWALELASMTTFKMLQGDLIVPYQDHYALLRLPHLVKKRFGLQVRASFTRESTLRYYGLGNASRLPAGADLTSPTFAYDRVHPELRVNALYNLSENWVLDGRLNYTHNWVDVAPDTMLSADFASADPVVNRLLGRRDDLARHGVLYVSGGLQWDARDHNVATTRGQWHTVRVDWAPGGGGAVPYHFARVNGTARFYVPLDGSDSVMAFRVVGDFLVGDAPIYELARFNDTSAFGGPEGVRGVPAQRYHGKAKLFGTAEWRQTLFRLDFLDKVNTFGVAVYSDVGRLWTEYARRTDLDGSALGLRWGLGAGLRWLSGCSFVVRFDLAWSNDARPLTAYFGAGQTF